MSPHCCKGAQVELVPRTDIGQSPCGARSELQLESRVARDEPELLVEAVCFLPRRVRGELNQCAAASPQFIDRPQHHFGTEPAPAVIVADTHRFDLPAKGATSREAWNDSQLQRARWHGVVG